MSNGTGDKIKGAVNKAKGEIKDQAGTQQTINPFKQRVKRIKLKETYKKA